MKAVKALKSRICESRRSLGLSSDVSIKVETSKVSDASVQTEDVAQSR